MPSNPMRQRPANGSQSHPHLMNPPPPRGAWSTFIRTGLALMVLPVAALAVTFESGPLRGSFDSTFSYGGIYRLGNQDPRLIGVANGGLANSVNSDDGNLNYDRGLVSATFKGTHDLEVLAGDHLGFFGRFTYFYDHHNANGKTDRTPLSQAAIDYTVRRLDLLDLYFVYRGELAQLPFDLRIGRQVLSLGESTFIPNGLNVVNPVEVARLRIPGAELREAFLPVNMIKAQLELTETMSFEAFWLLEFRRTEIEPAGTYFSTNDFASRGGNRVMLGFGALSDQQNLGAIPRDLDREGNNYSQFGFALRNLLPNLNSTELGLYYLRYHSRLPIISARTPTGPVSTELVVSTATNLATAQLAPAMIGFGFPPAAVPGALQTLIGAALTGVPAAALPPELQPFYPSAVAIANGARQIGLLTAAATGRYFIEYPEDIDMFGVSFNTDIPGTGIAWQGEVAYKRGVPLQVDDVELLFATLSALSPVFGPPNNQMGGFLGQYNRELSGYRRLDVWTAQTTLTKVFGPHFGADQIVVLGEVGAMWVPDLPAQNILRFEVPGTYTSGNQAAMVGTGSALPATPLSAFADKSAWGYQLAARLDYTNVFAGVNMSPSLAFSHDVSGNSPAPMTNYLKGRKSLSLAVEFVWDNRWSLDLRYVNYSGAGVLNQIADRDFASATLKLSF
jgi:hypothetical protein